MRINVIDNTNFGVRIKIDKTPQELQSALNKVSKQLPEASLTSYASSCTGIPLSITTGVPITNSAGTVFDVLGSAFISKGAGIDSFGIVPSAIAKTAPHTTFEAVESSQANPSLIGSLFSTIGGFLHKMGRIKIQTKQKVPS